MPAKKKEKETQEENKSKLRIKLKAYDFKVIDSSAKQIIDTALRYGSDVSGPVPLPTEIHKYTVNRSTFVHKDAREQFEVRIHKRIIDILLYCNILINLYLELSDGLNLHIQNL